MNSYWMTMTTAIMAATSSNPINYTGGSVDLNGVNGLFNVFTFPFINNVSCTNSKCIDWAPKRVIIKNDP